MYFRDVIGQDKIKKQLINAAQTGRFGHALYFMGDTGYGGLPLALAFYRYLVCKKRGEEDSCGECPSCVKLNNLAHPDLHFFYPVSSNKDSGTKPLSSHFVEPWREMIQEDPYFTESQWMEKLDMEKKTLNISVLDASEMLKKFSLKPFESEYQTVFIWMPEKMNTQAANRILKMLEEPPVGSLFFLVGESPDLLLPTIVSRLQTVKLNPIETKDLALKIGRQFSIDSESAGSVASLAHGDFNLAKTVLRDGGGSDISERFQTWMRICYKIDFFQIQKWVDEMHALNRDRQKLFCKHALNIFRNSLMMNYVSDDMVEVLGSDAQFLEKFAPFIHAGNIQYLIEEVEDLMYHIDRNAYAKIAFMDVTLKVCKLIRIKPVN